MGGYSNRLLEVNNLRTSFFITEGEVKAVDGISYYIDKEEIVAIVGESGCGKSVSQMSIIQLIQSPPGKILGGEAIFEGRDLLKLNSSEIRRVRGAEIAFIFQEPMTALNPVITVGKQLSKDIRTHKKVSRKEAWNIATEALKAVKIPDPEKRMKNYPFEMSGGMRQRVMIANAVACNANLIIADEPTTALDVTTQAQVMELLVSIVKEYKTSLIVVTHNLGLVTRYADRIYVMYAGRIVESGTCKEIMKNPSHPYTLGLLKSVPKLDSDVDEKLIPITGAPPTLLNAPDTCAFLPRCPYASEICRCNSKPELHKINGGNHLIACYRDIARLKNEHDY
ncbi:MAG: ABC transporter ATP-binding protein [Clostridiaceae bacterium]|nr:ABC transporter ATP-binding protein [Clostridiaceae bacterium]